MAEHLKRLYTFLVIVTLCVLIHLSYHLTNRSLLVRQSLTGASSDADLYYVEESDVGERLATRQRRLRQLCDDHQAEISQERNRLYNKALYQKHISGQKRVVIHHRTKLALCLQAKGGSSFWKHLFMHVNPGPPVQYYRVKNTLKTSFVDLKAFRKAVDGLDEKGYTMFVFGRNPWQRLVSLYRQKVESKDPTSKEYRYVKAACMKRDVEPFVNLLKCVLLTWKIGVPDRHWEPLLTRCDICTIPYTYLGVLDHMNEESIEIMQSAGLKGNVTQFVERVRTESIREIESNTTKPNYASYYKNVPVTLLNQLQVMYKYDLMLLNVPSSPL